LRKWFRKANHPVPCAAQGRINAQNDRVQFAVVWLGPLEQRNCRASRLDEALLHLLKLLRRYAHPGDSASRKQASKAENRFALKRERESCRLAVGDPAD
jgi:hypothetical protein